MKMGLKIAPLVGLVVALVLVGEPAVYAQQTGNWTGQTSQGQQITFTVQPGSPEFIDSWAVGVALACPDGSGISAGFGFSGFNVPINSEAFQFKYYSVFYIFSWKGKFPTNTTAKGSVNVQYAAFVFGTNQLQDCQQKVTWTAAPGAGSAPRHFDHYVQVTRHPDGKITVSQQY
jgi:hypothetical protein